MMSERPIHRTDRATVLSRLAALLAACGLLTACAVPPSPVARVPRGPLPGEAEPLAYDVEMRIDPRETTFSGTASIRIRLALAVDGIWLHGQDLAITRAVVLDDDGREIAVDYREVGGTGVARVAFPRTLGPGEIEMRLAYDAALSDRLAGL